MSSQMVLEESIEKMGVWFSKHPAGAINVSGLSVGAVRILPIEGGWTLKSVDAYGRSEFIGTYASEDLDKLVLKLLHWSWKGK